MGKEHGPIERCALCDKLVSQVYATKGGWICPDCYEETREKDY